MNGRPTCRAYRADFRDWEACYLENDLLRLVAVPDIGGRIMALDLGPYSYFFIDPDLAGKLFSADENQGDGSLRAWKNYGGDKTWPAPQGWDNEEQWPGPPDPVLDSGRYSVENLACDDDMATIRMVSPADEHTGIQITRQFTLRRGSSQVEVQLSFKNVVDRPVRWSIWDVVQLRAERMDNGRLVHDPSCVVTVPLNPRSRFPAGYQVMFGAEDNPQWRIDAANGLFYAGYDWHIGKVGLDSQAGWVAFSHGREGYAFVERFAVEQEAEYPDGGMTVECWTVGAGQVGNLDYGATSLFLMETEVLAPLRTIAPGKATSFNLRWDACMCPGPVVDVTPGGCVARPLSATPVGGAYVRVQGTFGVHAVGILNLVWRDSQGQVLESRIIGGVEPLSAVILDRVLPVPDGARRIELQLTTEQDHREERLGLVVMQAASEF